MAETTESKKYLGQAATERLIQLTQTEISNGDQETLDNAKDYTDSVIEWGTF